jgi:hypothetical protein
MNLLEWPVPGPSIMLTAPRPAMWKLHQPNKNSELCGVISTYTELSHTAATIVRRPDIGTIEANSQWARAYIVSAN